MKISVHVDGGRAEGLACADPGARTPIGMSGKVEDLIIMVPHFPALGSRRASCAFNNSHLCVLSIAMLKQCILCVAFLFV